jgi:hypothetical protein
MIRKTMYKEDVKMKVMNSIFEEKLQYLFNQRCIVFFRNVMSKKVFPPFLLERTIRRIGEPSAAKKLLQQSRLYYVNEIKYIT